jgi:hypothetical protein
MMFMTVSVRLAAPKYKLFRRMADEENRTLSNFIETAAMKYVQENELIDKFEMDEIRANKELNRSLKRGHKDAAAKRGRFVD